MGEEEVLADGLAGADYKGCIWNDKAEWLQAVQHGICGNPKEEGQE